MESQTYRSDERAPLVTAEKITTPDGADAVCAVAASITPLAREIAAHIKAGNGSKSGADTNYLRAGEKLLEVQPLVSNFSAFLKEQCPGLKKTRAHQLMRIARGETTLAAEREKIAARVAKHRAVPRKLSLSEFKQTVDRTFAHLSDDDLLDAQLYVERWERSLDGEKQTTPAAAVTSSAQ